MAWKTYFLKYRLLSPLHIGDLSLGNVQKTLFYIPGRTLWGAATAILTRTNKASPVFADYQKIGEDVSNGIRFGYFFPEYAGTRYLPMWTGNDIKYGPNHISVEDMQHRFLFSEASTAIVNNTFAAETASLHETEYVWLQNRLFSSQNESLYFSGYLYLNLENLKVLNHLTEDALLSQLETLFVGANRRMGAGKLQRSECELKTEQDCADPEPGDDDRSMKFEDQKIAAAHILHEPDSMNFTIKGPIQPLVFRDWAEHRPPDKRFGAGQNVVYEGVAWKPGALIPKGVSIQVTKYGRWKIYAG